ncbi:MAG: ATP-binding protein [Gammaproteobacteria bacterium]|nr:ATP-binding protein [Gammaproteobacteria bacterium]
MIERDIAPRLIRAAKAWPAITLTGPRQSGKTTLCRALFPDKQYLSLEALDKRVFATEDPRGFLAQMPDGGIIDEVQRVPELLSYLQDYVDDNPAPGRWILTGSHNFSLLKSIGQSLAGRTAVYELLPLSREELLRFGNHPKTMEESLLMGSYPLVFDEGLEVSDWFGSYTSTYLERDVRMIGNVSDLGNFRRFLMLCAGRTSQLLNLSSLAGDCGISQPTAKAWIDILETGYIAFRLPPLISNLRKRIVKMPKLHFLDTGLICWLLGIHAPEQLHTHPLRGPIFETWVIAELVKRKANLGETGSFSYYRDQNGAEADLIIEKSAGKIIVECKSSSTPSSNLIGNALRIQAHLKRADIQSNVVAVYAGDQVQHREKGSLIPWNKLHAIDWDTHVQQCRKAM